MKYHLFLFARLDSSRLPRKQLLPLDGQFNTLSLLVARLKLHFPNNKIVLASTNRPVDAELSDYARQLDIDFFGGDSANTTLRMVQAMRHYGDDFGVRICCDSPLMDGGMVHDCVEKFLKNPIYDIYSNIDFPTHIRPPGQIAELVTKPAMERVLTECQDLAILEHCTYYIHLNKQKFNYGVFEQSAPTSFIKHLALDTQDDYIFLQGLVRLLDNPVTAQSQEIADAYQKFII